MNPRFASHLLVALLALGGALGPLVARAQTADVNAEAQVFFERGNRLFAESARARGARQRTLLEEALQAYVSTLRIVRSRNALFNAAVVLERLERPNEAFAYLVEYLAIEGLSDAERRDGEARVTALRPRVAVVRVMSTPPGAEVFVDRLDLAPRGRTPLELALEPGPHTLVTRHPHYEEARRRVTARTGEAVDVAIALEASGVALDLRVEGDAAGVALTLDGAAIEPGRHTLPPGEHVAVLALPDGRREERRFRIAAGDAPQTLVLRVPQAEQATLIVEATRPARVRVDGALIGEGIEVRATVTPGERVVEVEVGGETQRREVTIAAHAEARVRFRFDAPTRRFGAAPAALAVTTGVAAAAWAGLAGGALAANGRYESRCPAADDCQARFDRVKLLNLVADLTLGVASALLVTTIVLFAARGRGGRGSPSEAQVELRLGPLGASVGGSF